MRKLLGSAAVAAMLAFSGTAVAGPVTIDVSSVTGVWNNIQGGSNVNFPTTNEVRWGSGTPQSGYRFVGVAPPPQLDIAANTVFDLGTFTHFNFPISAGTSITEATLTVTIVGSASNGSSVPLNITSDFVFDHFETPNAANPCANGEPNGSGVNVNGCADIVTPTLNAGASETFTIDGVTYVLDVTGFDIGASFETVEGEANDAVLRAEFRPVGEVPEPATVVILGSGLLGLGLAARRRRRQIG